MKTVTMKHTINNRHASGFCKQRSTETALIKVNNDSLLAADSGARSILILLDLSSVLDTVNRDILINRLLKSVSV